GGWATHTPPPRYRPPRARGRPPPLADACLQFGDSLQGPSVGCEARHMSGERAGEASEAIAVASAHTPGVRAAIARAKLEWECTVDALPDLICLLDGSGQVLRVNRVCERWNLGSIAEVLGRGLHDILHANCGAAACQLKESL